MTAERRPLCLRSAACTIVVALAMRDDVIVRSDCEPLVAPGSSSSLADRWPLVPAAACWIALQEFRDRLAGGCLETFFVAGSARLCQPWASDGAAAVTSAICRELMGWVVPWWVVA